MADGGHSSVRQTDRQTQMTISVDIAKYTQHDEEEEVGGETGWQAIRILCCMLVLLLLHVSYILYLPILCMGQSHAGCASIY